jgi:ATP-dependent DNA helicase RecG
VSLDVPIGELRGAGPVTAARLAERGVTTARDLLLRLPRGYDDLRRLTPIAELASVADGTVVLVRGSVKRVHVFPRRLLDVFVEQEGAVVRARWFRPPRGMSRSFAKGTEVALAGPLRTAADGTRELIHASNVTAAMAAAAGAADLDGAAGTVSLGLRPRYAVVDGVNGRTLATLRQSALARLGPDTQELLPAAARARLGLPTLAESLRRLHAPDGQRDADGGPEAATRELAAARRRIALEALFVAQLAFVMRRAAAGRAAPFALRADAGARLESALGFSLTASQRRALADVAADLGRTRPMQRLLVGDVGSGKTAVALGAAAQVAAAGGQTLMMVPTEVLAEQQARALTPCAARLGFEVGLLTGAAARAAILDGVGSGRIALLVGTHALLSDDVRLPRLGLVIVDEQHRFGVSSRARLGRDDRPNGSSPHLLSMSATPIPRSLALALHGDMDASFLVERPAGRLPAATTLCLTAAERDAAYARLRDAVAAGEQAFVVCPVREKGASESGELGSTGAIAGGVEPSQGSTSNRHRRGGVTAVAQHARLARELRPARVGLLHGGLSSGDKEAALRAFASGATNVLVATTVVELGIDVPSATVMIVEGADRFGLAQLHQLRGRVGRGTRPGGCWLCTGGAPITDEARARLSLLATTDDGFALAEADLAQRGAGEVYGTRQAGEAALAADSLTEMAELTALARAEAEALWSADPGLTAVAHAAAAAAARERLRTLYGGDAG